jgi:hypothetical protein
LFLQTKFYKLEIYEYYNKYVKGIGRGINLKKKLPGNGSWSYYLFKIRYFEIGFLGEKGLSLK